MTLLARSDIFISYPDVEPQEAPALVTESALPPLSTASPSLEPGESPGHCVTHRRVSAAVMGGCCNVRLLPFWLN